MHPYRIPIWKQAPLLRIVVTMMIGILIQYYFDFSLLLIVLSLCINSALYFTFYKLPLHYRYRFQRLQSVFLILIIISFGMMLTRHQDLRNSNEFFLNHYEKHDAMLLKIEAPLNEKQN